NRKIYLQQIPRASTFHHLMRKNFWLRCVKSGIVHEGNVNAAMVVHFHVYHIVSLAGVRRYVLRDQLHYSFVLKFTESHNTRPLVVIELPYNRTQVCDL